jgi:putative aldouronate transport system permease protein
MRVITNGGIKIGAGRKTFVAFNTLFMIFISFVTVAPFINMLATSFSSSTAVMAGRVSFLPVNFELESYQRILKESRFWTGYKNTLIYTVLGTFISMCMTILCAYPLSRKDFYGRKPLLFMMIFTMYFGGGLIPNYLLMTNIGLKGTMWAVLLPGAIGVYNMLVMRTFFNGISESLIEAAEIDGLGQFMVLIRIVLPLSKAILATMILFYAVGYWNDWFGALLYLRNNQYPVTLFLRDITMGVTLRAQSGQAIQGVDTVVGATLQAATVMLVTVPILCIYPFIQKHFVQGVMIGSIKE